VVDRISVPALIVTAADDPFVPADAFRQPPVTANPRISVELSAHGGHCAFVAQADGNGFDGYWAERRIVEFATSVCVRKESTDSTD